MIGFDPHTRRPALPVPTRRDARVAPSAQSGDAGSKQRERALVPVKSTPRPHAAQECAAAKPAHDVALSCVRAGLALQADAPAPRRGLRADAVERQRYRDSYEAAGRQALGAARPTLVRSA